MSSHFADNIKNSEIVCGIKSDHSIVSCKVLIKDCPKGKGYWKLNCHYLRHDADFVSFIKSKISEFKEIHEDTDCNPHVIWDAFKCTITGHCIQYCSRMKKDKLKKSLIFKLKLPKLKMKFLKSTMGMVINFQICLIN